MERQPNTFPRAVNSVAETPSRSGTHHHLVAVANREPYSHDWQPDGSCKVVRPASGLVTALEPILEASGGTWIAHASGSADHSYASRDGRLRVPPGKATYTLRRVWLDADLYDRYYNGLANEGLWPLCHQAFTKPVFRHTNWDAYREVNEVFARAAVAEIRPQTNMLIQDYHFALVPDLVRRRAPLVAMNLFWHIPWPHADVIAVVPWKEELLRGMLGADVIGFHTQQYCMNFLESVRRYVRCPVDFKRMTVTSRGRLITVRPYPISIEWPYPARSREAGRRLRESLAIGNDVHVSVAVDRIDYTKGLLERVASIEEFLERHPSMHERFALVQIASPSRTTVPAYQRLSTELQSAARRINDRFSTPSWKPVHLKIETLPPADVRTYYAMANSAIVTPLHDGMNLVAKEYVASCEDADGVLILSEFAGAADELTHALLVNPFDTRAVADAIASAVRMTPHERRSRMASMRSHLAANSIHEWSQRIVTDLDALRRSKPTRPSPALHQELAI